jgi:hypothetical protein
VATDGRTAATGPPGGVSIWATEPGEFGKWEFGKWEFGKWEFGKWKFA